MNDEPITQVFIESEIVRLCAYAEKVTQELAKRANASAHADAAYKKAHASAFLMAQGKTVGDREAVAALETADEYLARKIAESLLAAASEAGRNVRAQLDSLRSLNANQRAMITGG